jgi:imidazolonepropionase-like amidohydrolase
MRFVFATIAVAAILTIGPTLAGDVVAIKAGRVIDVIAGDVLGDQIILIEDKRIAAVGKDLAIPAGAKVIDLGNATVLPGLVDAHTHLTYDPVLQPEEVLALSHPRLAIIAAMNARATLLAGFTTVRDAGAEGYADVAVRDGIERGDIMGPRVFAAGPWIGQTGGHCDDNSLGPQYDHTASGVADGVEAVRRMVRRHAKYGVDLIKFCASGGIFTLGDQPGAPEYSFGEIKVLVEEAHALGRTAAAHAHAAEGIKNAIRAGADSIEHASLADDEGIAMARRAGTMFVMDIYNTDYTQAEGRKNGLDEETLAQDREYGEKQRETFRRAVKGGVTMAFGTDAGLFPHGTNAKQFSIMVRYGMTAMAAIRAATVNGAKLLKREKDFGAIEAGRFADIIAVEGDPLKDVSALESVTFVMKEGRVYRGTASQCEAAPAAWPCEAPAH